MSHDHQVRGPSTGSASEPTVHVKRGSRTASRVTRWAFSRCRQCVVGATVEIPAARTAIDIIVATAACIEPPDTSSVSFRLPSTDRGQDPLTSRAARRDNASSAVQAQVTSERASTDRPVPTTVRDPPEPRTNQLHCHHSSLLESYAYSTIRTEGSKFVLPSTLLTSIAARCRIALRIPTSVAGPTMSAFSRMVVDRHVQWTSAECSSATYSQ